MKLEASWGREVVGGGGEGSARFFFQELQETSFELR